MRLGGEFSVGAKNMGVISIGELAGDCQIEFRLDFKWKGVKSYIESSLACEQY